MTHICSFCGVIEGSIVEPDVFLDRCDVRLPTLLFISLPDPFVSATRFVLRKKPAGELVASTAHQIEREYTMLRALHTHNTKPSTPPERRVPIPEPIVLCEDKEVIGTPFYIMEFLEGRIFTDVRMPEVSPETRREWCVPLRLLRYVRRCSSRSVAAGSLLSAPLLHCRLSHQRTSACLPSAPPLHTFLDRSSPSAACPLRRRL